MRDKLDYPFDEVVIEATKQIAAGHIIHQKFTCVKCGARQTMEEPNRFYETGQCEECKGITNIKERGCNFLLIGSDIGSIIRGMK